MRNDNEEKHKKAGSPIFILIIFVVLIIFIFFIPDIYKKFNSNIADILGVGSKKQTIKNVQEEDKLDAMSDYFQIGSLSTLEYNNLTFSNVLLENGILYLTISSESEEEINLNELDYYLEFYESRATFVGRRTLKGIFTKSVDLKIDVSSLNINTSTYFAISHISSDSIPKKTFLTDESGTITLNCNKADNVYIYDFNLDGLVKMTHKYTYVADDLDIFTSKLMEYQKIVKQYNDLNGVNALITDNNLTFIYILELYYDEIDSFPKIDDEYKFEKNTTAAIVEFKMNAEGYECE